MRGYYAIIGDKPYELPKLTLTRSSQILGEEKDHVEVESRPDQKSVTVKVTVSNLSRETWTNKQLADMFKEFIRNSKTTQIPKLSNFYTVYIQYELWDDVCGELVDKGIGTKDVKPEVFQFPLGLNEENEYVARLGFCLPVSITQRYRSKQPFGMMRASSVLPQYTLVIRRIWVTELMERAWSLSPQCNHKRPHTHYYEHQHCGDCDCHDHMPEVIGHESKQWGRPYQMHDPECGVGPVGMAKNCHSSQHPSMSDVTCVPVDRMFDSRDLLVIYDTADFTEEYQDVRISFAPEEVNIKFTAKSLSPILINREEIVKLLQDVKQEIIDAGVKPPVTPPSEDDTPNTPIEGDDKDQEPPKKDDPTVPDSENTGGDTNPTDPIDGDDKDIGGGKEDPTAPDSTESGSQTEDSGSENPTDPEKTEGN